MGKTEGYYDFKAMGQAIKRERKARGWTREQLGEKIDLAPRYIMSIENEGQHPSLQKFYEFVTMFQLSVDEFFFPKQTAERSSKRLQLDAILDQMSEQELIIISAVAREVKNAVAFYREEERKGAMAETLLNFLREYGTVPEKLEEKIKSQTEEAVLHKWIRYAAGAGDIEKFVTKIMSEE
ncbi:MAG: helix-turn-helix transcriptional regulator [Ruminococcus sp.]